MKREARKVGVAGKSFGKGGFEEINTSDVEAPFKFVFKEGAGVPIPLEKQSVDLLFPVPNQLNLDSLSRS